MAENEHTATDTDKQPGLVEKMKSLIENKIDAESESALKSMKKSNNVAVHEKVLYTLCTLKKVLSCCINVRILE